MARIRTVKPDFWTDESITECSLSARLLFIGMFNFSDDNGNIQRSSKQLKMRIFPADSIDCEPLLNELFTHGLITEYSVSDKKYIHINGFRKHQVINRPSKSNIPKPETVSAHGGLTEYSSMEEEGKGREGKEGLSALNADAWGAWIDYRKKRKLAGYTTDKVKNQLAELDFESQAKCVEDSIAQNYNGLFPKKFMAKSAKFSSLSDSQLVAEYDNRGWNSLQADRFTMIKRLEAAQ